jgi:hypothetical protein
VKHSGQGLPTLFDLIVRGRIETGGDNIFARPSGDCGGGFRGKGAIARGVETFEASMQPSWKNFKNLWGP